MKHKNLLILLILTWTKILFAQGLLMDERVDSVYQQIPTLSIGTNGAKTSINEVRAWSLKPYCPTPKHQGQNGSCVGWAVGYAALSIQNSIANQWKEQAYLTTENAFSPTFIYNQIKTGDCQSGAYIHDALQLLQDKGDVLAKEFVSKDCQQFPTEQDLNRARLNKIESYAALFPPDVFLQTKINHIKKSLAQNHPVIVGMKLPKNFNKIRKKAKYWRPKIRKRTKFFNHALVVVGFDDSRGAFEVMNSWGEQWGNKGFIWIRYRAFAKYCQYAYQMDLPKKPVQEKQYTGKFSLRRFEALMANGQAIFSEENVQLKENIYILRKKVLSRQTVFQLLVSQMTANTYLYALGIEPDGAIKNYYPTQKENPNISGPEKELYIPAKQSGLLLKKSGKEYIVLLYANQAIPNIEAQKIALGKAKGSIWEKLESVFGQDLVPQEFLNYAPKEMKFANGIPKGFIVPIVLEIEVE